MGLAQLSIPISTMFRTLLVYNRSLLFLSLVFAQVAFGSSAADPKSVSKLESRADSAKAGICNYSAFQSGSPSFRCCHKAAGTDTWGSNRYIHARSGVC